MVQNRRRHRAAPPQERKIAMDIPTVYLVGCSDPLPPRALEQAHQLAGILQGAGRRVATSPLLGRPSSPIRRAEILNRAFADPTATAVFDLSGGDLANQLLPWLDLPAIAASRAVLWGYSDLTCLLNALSAAGKPVSVLYQPRHLTQGGQRLEQFLAADGSLFAWPVEFLRGRAMAGTLAGGNLRCLLKLAGTPCWPDLTGKLLVLEAQGGSASRIAAGFAQLALMGVFDQIAGLILGRFTQLEAEGVDPASLLLPLPAGLPLARTRCIGHQTDALAALLGAQLDCRDGWARLTAPCPALF